MGRSRKPLYGQPYRGFESPSLRHDIKNEEKSKLKAKRLFYLYDFYMDCDLVRSPSTSADLLAKAIYVKIYMDYM